MRRLLPALLPLVAILVLDQVTKAWALSALWEPPRAMVAIPGWLHFVPVENRGIAFGLFRGYGTLLAIAVLALAAVLAARGWRDLLAAPLPVRLAIGLVAGGGLGNLIDRLRLGFVVDFVTLPPVPLFRTFNVADSAITVGATLLALHLLFRKKEPLAPEPR